MPAVYEIGEQVLIKPIGQDGLSVREAALAPFSGQTGVVTNFYWITPPTGEVFYLYTVQVPGNDKELTLYEDEITNRTERAAKARRGRGR